MQWRRDKVLDYTSRGYTQREIAVKLQVAPSTIAEDQIFLRNQASNNIRDYIDKRLPGEFESVLNGITMILKEAWLTSEREDIEVKEKLSALSLAKEAYSIKLDMITNVGVIDNASRFISEHKEKQQQQQREEDNNNTTKLESESVSVSELEESVDTYNETF